ncbi:hypothetical protein GGI15_004937 [Coemansia interrupta]|uniref:Kinetochore protein Spc24 n=1 Tax=Coemansia interrupta TaxID=1126814 RepID=A0A9W8H415_9FUNG|nr:hypothetical protein GGI15_004937 [Coemansia interrupta]
MSIDNLTEQHNLLLSAHASLQQGDDHALIKQIHASTMSIHARRQQTLDKQQEALQLLSRRLQAARARVDASRARREEKSHAETMREMHLEKQAAEQVIGAQETWHEQLGQRADGLEHQLGGLDENVERGMAGDPDVLRLQVLRGLGLDPKVEEGGVKEVAVWSELGAEVVRVDEEESRLTAHQLAAKLWDLCS